MSEPQKAWTTWHFNPACTARGDCSCCGYVWGPGNSARSGQRVKWDVPTGNGSAAPTWNHEWLSWLRAPEGAAFLAAQPPGVADLVVAAAAESVNRIEGRQTARSHAPADHAAPIDPDP